MKRQKISESEGTLDDFIDKLVSSPVQNPKSIKLELLEEETNNDTVFNVLIEIFSKTMKYIYGDRNGRVELDELGEEDLNKMSKYFASFGFQLFVDIIEGQNRHKTSYGKDENTPIKADELKAHCLRLQTQKNLYVIYFDVLNS